MLLANRMPEEWYLSYAKDVELRCFEVARQHFHKPMVIVRNLLIKNDLTWQVHIGEHVVSPHCSVLKDFPSTITREEAVSIIHAISVGKICSGNFEDRFIYLARIRKGKFLSPSGKMVAFLDESFCIEVDGKQYGSTIRHCDCELLIQKPMCLPCSNFRNTLRSLMFKYNNQSSRPLSVYTNTRFLRTPQKNTRLVSLRKAIKMKNRQIKQLRAKLSSIVECDGFTVDESLTNDLQKVVDNHSILKEDEFKRIFWEQQVWD